MLNFVKQSYVIDINDLNEVEGLENILDDLTNWWKEGFGQNSYITIDKNYLEEMFYDPETNELGVLNYPCLFHLLQLMNSGHLPQEFILLIWW